MIDCKRASQLISLSLDRKLSLAERISLRIHTFICDPCKRFGQQLRAMRNALQRMSSGIENDSSIRLSPESKKRIANAIDAIDPK
jgi:hypothetical protein